MKVLDLYNDEDHDIPIKSINLTTEEKIALEVLHDTNRDGRVRDRIKAVLLGSKGWSTTMITQALRLHETTICRHIDDYVSKNKLAPELSLT